MFAWAFAAVATDRLTPTPALAPVFFDAAVVDAEDDVLAAAVEAVFVAAADEGTVDRSFGGPGGGPEGGFGTEDVEACDLTAEAACTGAGGTFCLMKAVL